MATAVLAGAVAVIVVDLQSFPQPAADRAGATLEGDQSFNLGGREPVGLAA
jgi:hypothetical protein